MGLQLDADVVVPVQQGLQEEVGVLSEPLQVRLGAAVHPVELLGPQRNVQQARLAQDVVGVAEALPPGVAVAVARLGRLQAYALRGRRRRDADRFALEGGAVRDRQLRLAAGGRRPLADGAAGAAAAGAAAAGAPLCGSG